MPRVSGLKRDMAGKYAVLWNDSWWLLVSSIGNLGVPGICAWNVRRIMTNVPPVYVESELLAPNSITLSSGIEYESIRPVLWKKADDERVIDPLASGLVDDGSLGAYVGEPKMLAQAPKRTKGRK